MNQEQKWNQLVTGVQIVAAEADVQLSVFPDLVCKPDEIALTFHEGFRFRQELFDAGRLSASAKDQVERIDSFFDDLTAGDPAIWTESAVRTDPKWADARELARALLLEMGERQQVPRLSSVTYVRSGEAPYPARRPVRHMSNRALSKSGLIIMPEVIATMVYFLIIGLLVLWLGATTLADSDGSYRWISESQQIVVSIVNAGMCLLLLGAGMRARGGEASVRKGHYAGVIIGILGLVLIQVALSG